MAGLVSQARAGDVAAQHGLYARFAPLMQRIAAPYRRDGDLCDELPGELYLLFQHLVLQYDSARGVRFTTYLVRALESSFLTLTRRYRRHSRWEVAGRFSDEDRDEAANGEGEEAFLLQRLALEQALTALTPLQHATCRLRLAGYTYTEIAARLGTRPATCRQAFHRARATLRPFLAEPLRPRTPDDSLPELRSDLSGTCRRDPS
jgi:RNA polymerase sigma factor (sigma-70 family)